MCPVCAGPCAINDRDLGEGEDFDKRPLLLMSDRDSGLWIFRYTGKEQGQSAIRSGRSRLPRGGGSVAP